MQIKPEGLAFKSLDLQFHINPKLALQGLEIPTWYHLQEKECKHLWVTLNCCLLFAFTRIQP